jgi:hypothetical protein
MSRTPGWLHLAGLFSLQFLSHGIGTFAPLPNQGENPCRYLPEVGRTELPALRLP